MREINLQEYQLSGPFQLSAGERDLLMESSFDIDVEPVAGFNTEYYLSGFHGGSPSGGEPLSSH